MQRIIRPIVVVVCVAACLLAACAFSKDRAPWLDRQETIDTFFQKPLKDQITSFPSYDLDDQYAIYMYGNQIRHPPAMYLAGPFGAEGQKIVELLTHHLAQAADDTTIRNLVLVFSEMSKQKSYSVAEDVNLMQLLNESVARMKNRDWKKISEKELASIHK